MFYNFNKKYIDNQLVMRSTLSCLPDQQKSSSDLSEQALFQFGHPLEDAGAKRRQSDVGSANAVS